MILSALLFFGVIIMVDTEITGSYITTIELAEAYFEGDPRATAFLALEEGMAWYLRRATKKIDNLPLMGTTYYYFKAGSTGLDGYQPRQFPRIIDGIAYGWNMVSSIPEVPQEILDACCEEALALYQFYADSDNVDRKSMKEQGVKAYNLGGVYSETLGRSNADIHKGLISSEAYELLKGYIAGAVEITF